MKHDRSQPSSNPLKAQEDIRSVRGFGSVYDAYAERIWRHIFIRVRLREEANDLTSQVFYKTWEYVKSGRRITNVSAFLYRTADHAIIDWYRVQKRHVSLKEYLEQSASNEPVTHERFDEKAFAQTEAQRFQRALQRMSEKDRTLLVMRFVDELDIEEIARALGKSRGAVAVALHRALKILQQFMR